MIVKRYGSHPYNVFILHGGPGAAGEVAPVAIELSKKFGVLEPYQTGKSIKEQVDELKEQINKYCTMPVKLVGYSYGAWLAYIFAAKYNETVQKIILICSGSFEEKHNINMLYERLSRLTHNEAEEVRKLLEIISDISNKNIDKEFKRFGVLISKADTYEEIPGLEKPEIFFRPDIHQSVWKEAKEMRRTGALLNLGKNIKCSVTAIHGDYDPHPAKGVEEPLKKIITDFKMILLEKCGHTPWRENHAREKFFEVLENELTET